MIECGGGVGKCWGRCGGCRKVCWDVGGGVGCVGELCGEVCKSAGGGLDKCWGKCVEKWESVGVDVGGKCWGRCGGWEVLGEMWESVLRCGKGEKRCGEA